MPTKQLIWEFQILNTGILERYRKGKADENWMWLSLLSSLQDK